MNKVTRIKNANYTTISNVFLRDKELSLKAKGLLATILSLPENWDFSIKGICATIKEGTTAVYSAIDELKTFGYCKVETLRDEKGRVTGNDYTFYENPNVENLNMDNQVQLNKDIINISLPNTKDNHIKEENNKEIKKESDELFETCWIAYRRKGKKGKAKPYWDKLPANEKDSVLQHIKIYTKTRELQYQQDFERYLRDKTFLSVVVSKNNVVYDPTKLGKGESVSKVYMPSGNFSITWDEQLKAYLYIGFYSDGQAIADGYTDSTRPDGARIVLNNGRGELVWSSITKTWIKQ